MKRVLVMMVAATACSSGPELEPLVLADGCQPFYSGQECFMPYPSDFYLVDD